MYGWNRSTWYTTAVTMAFAAQADLAIDKTTVYQQQQKTRVALEGSSAALLVANHHLEQSVLWAKEMAAKAPVFASLSHALEGVAANVHAPALQRAAAAMEIATTQ